jgi:hypothetical protein
MAAPIDEVANRAGTLNTGDEVEDAIVARIRQLGRQALGQSAGQRSAAVQPARAFGLRQVGKKTLLADDRRPSRVERKTLAERAHTQRPFCASPWCSRGGCSRWGQRALTDFGADRAFAKAAAKMQEHHGVSVPGERARTVTWHHAPVLAKPAPQPVRTLPARGAERIVAKADGTMMPIVDPSAAPPGADRRKFRQVHSQEARLAAVRA